MQEPQILDGAEEFRLGPAGGDGGAGSNVGALLVHGFTGSPQSMRGLGEYLAARDIGVYGVRLPGHGTTWQDLNGRSSDEWVQAVETEFEKMEKAFDQVFIVGLSFGVTLTLEFAARNPGRAAGLVALSGFMQTPDPRRFLSPVIKRVVKSMPGVANDISDPEGRELAYDRLPTVAANSMLRFCKRARTDLPKVTDPLLIVHSRNDHTAHPSNAKMFFERVSSEDKELVWLERSFHVITLDYEKDDVFERTHGFIKERAKSAI